MEINQATAWDAPPWHVCGRYGTMVREGNAFKLKYYDPKEAPPIAVVEGAAPGRKYDLGDRLPWKEETVPILPEKQLDFYQNIHEALTRNGVPHIRIEESRELMRVIELCRKRSKF